jgi:RNA polymerase sigma factor (TIGR02999 family)
MPNPRNDITAALDAMARGEQAGATHLLELVYAELRQIAAAKMSREIPGHTLQATALVHEAWMRLHPPDRDPIKEPDAQPHWQNRAHFFAAAAEAMRRVLIENARRKRALRHGGGWERVIDRPSEVVVDVHDDELLAVHEALDRFAVHAPQKAELVKLRYFIGLTMEEAADILGISLATAKRHWLYSRAWLFDAIRATLR